MVEEEEETRLLSTGPRDAWHVSAAGASSHVAEC